MKVGTILLFLFCLSQLTQAQRTLASITVYSVNLGIETPIAITCDEFMGSFPGQTDTTSCYAQETMNTIGAFF